MMSDFRREWGSEMTLKNWTLEGKNRTLEGKNRTLGGKGESKMIKKNRTSFMDVPFTSLPKSAETAESQISFAGILS